MHATQIHESNGERTFALIFQTGDEVMAGLQRFAQENQLSASHFTAIGAFSDGTLAYFQWDRKDYKKIPFREQVEVLTLSGDIAKQDGKRKIHAHVVLGRPDASTLGGHLMEAHVRPTLEVILTESPTHLQRKHDPVSGLALIDPTVSQFAKA